MENLDDSSQQHADETEPAFPSPTRERAARAKVFSMQPTVDRREAEALGDYERNLANQQRAKDAQRDGRQEPPVQPEGQ